MTKTEPILLDGVLTLRVTKDGYLVGYLRATGWIGQPPSDTVLATLDLGELT